MTIVLLPAYAQEAPPQDKFPKEKEEFLGELNAATKLLVQKKYSEAETALRTLRKKDITRSTWGKASFNLGFSLRMANKYLESIEVFQEIIASDVNDKEPSPNMMEHFMNYRHKSCWEISLNYELLEEYEKALHYMQQADSKHPFQDADLCGSCSARAKKSLEQRVQFLKSKATEKRTGDL